MSYKGDQLGLAIFATVFAAFFLVGGILWATVPDHLTGGEASNADRWIGAGPMLLMAVVISSIAVPRWLDIVSGPEEIAGQLTRKLTRKESSTHYFIVVAGKELRVDDNIYHWLIKG